MNADAAAEARDSLLRACSALAGQGRWNEAIARLAAAFGEEPADPMAAFTLATYRRFAGDLDGAIRLYRSLAAGLPASSDIALALARTLIEKGEPAQALRALAPHALAAPQNAALLATAGEAQLADGKPAAALALFRRAAVLAPEDGEIRANLAEVLSRERHYAEAERQFRAALRLLPGKATLHFNYAIHLFCTGRVAEGWQAYEARLAPDYPDAPVRHLSLPRWAGEPLTGRHVLVLSEQGLGDEIRFGALLGDLARRARRLTVETDPRLVRLYGAALPGARVHAFSRVKRGARPHFSYGWLGADDPPECYIEVGSLAPLLGAGIAEPASPEGYLSPLPDRQAEMERRIAPLAAGRARVGLVWTSAVVTPRRARSYGPVEVWASLLSLPDASFFALQYGAVEDQVAALAEAGGAPVHFFADLDLRADLETLAAYEASLDLVVAVPTATSALAAAVGTPTIEIVPYPDWVPSVGGRDAFLGQARRIVPEANGDWPAAMAAVRPLAEAALAARRRVTKA